MKVGIITIHNPPNYGAMLQAYALSTYLRKQGHEAEIVDYNQPALTDYFKFRWSFPPKVNNWLRLKRCREFVVNKQTKSAKTYNSPESFLEDAKKYDALITGSDQVWFTGPVQYYDPLYFLDLPDSPARKISYAASVGGTKDFEQFTDKVANAVRGIDFLSIRDEHSASLVRPFLSEEPTQVVDPTFLSSFEDLIQDSPPEREPYLLLFGNMGAKWNPLIKETARKLGVAKIVTLQYKNEAATQRIGAPSPEEWINFFYHAAGVITTYFHGTAFAINFQKQFLSIPTPGRVEKVRGLLSNVGLEKRFVADSDDALACVSRFHEPIDWVAASDALGKRVDSSKQFLATALA